MACPPGRRALLWASLLLPLSYRLLAAPVWPPQEIKEEEITEAISDAFLPTVEFAVYWFNENSQDQFAYRVLHILNSTQLLVYSSMIFSMKLQLGRTTCSKSEESLDSCPLQEDAGLNDTFTCFFTVGFYQWETRFSILNHRCLERLF